MPTNDPHQAAVEKRFGDKSTSWRLVFRVEWHAQVKTSISHISTFCSISTTELVVLTGPSSGLGRKTAQALLRTGEYHVIGAVRE